MTRIGPALLTAALALGCRGGDVGERPPARPVADEVARESGRDGDLTVGPAFSGVELQGTADGHRDASTLGVACRGLVLDQGVNHVVEVTAEQPLTLSATPRGIGVVDLFLAVSTPDGEWACADDGRDLDPVMGRMFVAGTYRVVVGTTNDTVVPYSLAVRPGILAPEPVTVGGRFPPAVVDGTPAERTTEGTFGGARLAAGTAQVVLAGQAGGTRDAVDVDPSCTGAIAQTPDHVLELLADQELTLRVRSDGDTTLVVQGPGGSVYCTDDDEGLDPVVRAPMAAGRYSVFVGAYDAAAAPSYALSISR